MQVLLFLNIRLNTLFNAFKNLDHKSISNRQKIYFFSFDRDMTWHLVILI